MTERTIRVGIVGAGMNTITKHIPGLQAIEGVEVAGVCNRTRASSERVAEQFNIPRVHTHWWDLLESPDTDAIVIGAWPYMHHPVTLAAIKAQKHVMCEARMAMNTNEAKEMLQASKSHPHLVTQIVPSPFTLGVDATVKRLIAGDYLGDVLALDVRSTTQGTFLDKEGSLHWRQNDLFSGYNVMNLGIWYEALMRWVGEALRVTAMGKTYVKMRLHPETGEKRAVRIPEHLNVIADMACGAHASFFFSAVAGLAQEDSAMIFGSEGSLRFSDGKLFGGRRGDTEMSEIQIPPEEQNDWRVEEEFVNAIRGFEPITHTTFDDGVKYMAFTEAVITSIIERRFVSMSELI
ncbi:MAG: Gfo/Idh/MocA family oxidoreductase [Chloroflexi bacterium]|nr:Gfo/Idh/MocA family oxidoreductase [Chloroflexota bacterium]